jgi:hypothetical protein
LPAYLGYALEQYCLKATTNEMVDEGYRLAMGYAYEEFYQDQVKGGATEVLTRFQFENLDVVDASAS